MPGRNALNHETAAMPLGLGTVFRGAEVVSTVPVSFVDASPHLGPGCSVETGTGLTAGTAWFCSAPSVGAPAWAAQPLGRRAAASDPPLLLWT